MSAFHLVMPALVAGTCVGALPGIAELVRSLSAWNADASPDEAPRPAAIIDTPASAADYA